MSELKCCEPCAQCEHERDRARAHRTALETIIGSPCPLVGRDCSCCGFAVSVAELALDDGERPDRLVDETAYDDEGDEILELRAEVAELRRRLAALERPGALRALEDPEAFRRGQEATRQAIERWLTDRYTALSRMKVECGETFTLQQAIRAREYEQVSPRTTPARKRSEK